MLPQLLLNRSDEVLRLRVLFVCAGWYLTRLGIEVVPGADGRVGES